MNFILNPGYLPRVSTMSLSAIFPANPAAAAVAAAVVDYANSSSAPVRVAVKVTRSAEAAVVSATDGTVRVCGDVAAGRLVAKAAGLYPKDDSHATEVCPSSALSLRFLPVCVFGGLCVCLCVSRRLQRG